MGGAGHNKHSGVGVGGKEATKRTAAGHEGTTLEKKHGAHIYIYDKRERPTKKRERNNSWDGTGRATTQNSNQHMNIHNTHI